MPYPLQVGVDSPLSNLRSIARGLSACLVGARDLNPGVCQSPSYSVVSERNPYGHPNEEGEHNGDDHGCVVGRSVVSTRASKSGRTCCGLNVTR